jgi:predicted phosphodiesterase
LLTGRDEKTIDSEVKGIKRINKNVSPELSTKLKHQIIAVDGEEDKKTIRDFVDNYFLAKDSAAFRTHIKQTSPDIKMTFIHNGANGEEEVTIPLQIQFFWPDARV